MSGVPVMYEQVDRQLRHYGWTFTIPAQSYSDSRYYSKDGFAVIVFVNSNGRKVRNMSLIDECENRVTRYLMTTDEKSRLFETKVSFDAFMDTVCCMYGNMHMRVENMRNLVMLERL